MKNFFLSSKIVYYKSPKRLKGRTTRDNHEGQPKQLSARQRQLEYKKYISKISRLKEREKVKGYRALQRKILLKTSELGLTSTDKIKKFGRDNLNLNRMLKKLGLSNWRQVAFDFKILPSKTRGRYIPAHADFFGIKKSFPPANRYRIPTAQVRMRRGILDTILSALKEMSETKGKKREPRSFLNTTELKTQFNTLSHSRQIGPKIRGLGRIERGLENKNTETAKKLLLKVRVALVTARAKYLKENTKVLLRLYGENKSYLYIKGTPELTIKDPSKDTLEINVKYKDGTTKEFKFIQSANKKAETPFDMISKINDLSPEHIKKIDNDLSSILEGINGFSYELRRELRNKGKLEQYYQMVKSKTDQIRKILKKPSTRDLYLKRIIHYAKQTLLYGKLQRDGRMLQHMQFSPHFILKIILEGKTHMSNRWRQSLMHNYSRLFNKIYKDLAKIEWDDFQKNIESKESFRISSLGTFDRVRGRIFSTRLNRTQKSNLRKLARLLRKHPSKQIYLFGTYDSHEDLRYGETKGEKRANAAIRYLKRLGVPSSQIMINSSELDKNSYDDSKDTQTHRIHVIIFDSAKKKKNNNIN